jgi:hypothetical protein
MEQTIKTATQKRAIARANMTPEEKQIHLEKRRIQRKENPLSEEQKEKRRIYQKNWRAELKERKINEFYLKVQLQEYEARRQMSFEDKDAEEKADEEIITCGKCFLTECCCEADRLQVIQDDENARANGYVEVDGRWVNKYHTSYNLKEEKEKTDIVKICVRCKYLEPHAPFGDADGTFGDCGHEYMDGERLCRSCVESNRVQRGLDEEYGGNCRCSYCGSTTHNGNLISPPNDRWYCNDCGLVEYEAEQKREKRRIYQKKWRAQKKEMKETGEIYIGMPRK